MSDALAKILERLDRVETAIAAIGHNGGPPLDETSPPVPDQRLPATAVARRYGVVIRTLNRWLIDPKLGFPKPEIVNGRRYWTAATLRIWDRSRARRSA